MADKSEWAWRREGDGGEQKQKRLKVEEETRIASTKVDLSRMSQSPPG